MGFYSLNGTPILLNRYVNFQNKTESVLNLTVSSQNETVSVNNHKKRALKEKWSNMKFEVTQLMLDDITRYSTISSEFSRRLDAFHRIHSD